MRLLSYQERIWNALDGETQPCVGTSSRGIVGLSAGQFVIDEAAFTTATVSLESQPCAGFSPRKLRGLGPVQDYMLDDAAFKPAPRRTYTVIKKPRPGMDAHWLALDKTVRQLLRPRIVIIENALGLWAGHCRPRGVVRWLPGGAVRDMAGAT